MYQKSFDGRSLAGHAGERTALTQTPCLREEGRKEKRNEGQREGENKDGRGVRPQSDF